MLFDFRAGGPWRAVLTGVGIVRVSDVAMPDWILHSLGVQNGASELQRWCFQPDRRQSVVNQGHF